MREYNLVLEDSQVSVINSAISDDPSMSLERWIDLKLESVLKAQHQANIARELRGHANACKLTLAYHGSVEQYIINVGIAERVTEFGGIGKFVQLANSSPKNGFIPADKINAAVKVVSAADVKAGN